MPTPAPAPAVAQRTPVATSPPVSRARSSALAREYAARLRALLAAVDTVEEAALAAIVDGLRALRDALVRAATGGSGGGRGATTATATPGPGTASGSPLDPSTVIAQIDAAIRAFQATMTGVVFAAQSEALAAGALTIDGILKPAVVLARDRAAAAKAAKATATSTSAQSRALVPTRGDRFGGGSLGGLGFGGPGAGGGRNRLPPVQITPPGGGGGGFGGGSGGGFPGGGGGGGGGGSPGLPHLSIVGAWPVIPDKLRAAVAALAAEEVTTLTTNLRQGMASAIRRAALGGLTPFEVMREVDRVLPATTKGAILAKGIGSSAERIVRTQMSRVFSKSADARANGLAEEMKAAGLDKGARGIRRQWIATLDSRTRASHLAAHGQTVGVGEDFVVDGERLAFPGDPGASAGNTINCRCRLVTVLPDDPAALFAR